MNNNPQPAEGLTILFSLYVSYFNHLFAPSHLSFCLMLMKKMSILVMVGKLSFFSKWRMVHRKMKFRKINFTTCFLVSYFCMVKLDVDCLMKLLNVFIVDMHKVERIPSLNISFGCSDTEKWSPTLNVFFISWEDLWYQLRH